MPQRDHLPHRPFPTLRILDSSPQLLLGWRQSHLPIPAWSCRAWARQPRALSHSGLDSVALVFFPILGS